LSPTLLNESSMNAHRHPSVWNATLSDLAQALNCELNVGGGTLPDVGRRMVTEVQASSNLVFPGALFVAIPGTKVDGHSFLCDAAERGAVAAVV